MATRATVSRVALLPQRARRPLRSEHRPDPEPRDHDEPRDFDAEAVEDPPEDDTDASPEDDTGATESPAEHTVSEGNENFLARYFKEMSLLSVLKPEQEFDSARAIETLELDLWTHILNYPQLVDPILAVAEREMESCPRNLATFRRTARAVRSTSTARQRYQRQAAAMAKVLYGRDVDRRMMFAVMRELTKIARGDRDLIYRENVGINVKSKVFQSYMSEMRNRFSRAQRCRNEFVKANLRLVVSIARRFNHGRMPLSDLIQEGNMGLIKAVERYDYRRGYRFSTYASWWIRHAISRALADKGRAVRLPVHMIDAYHKVTRTRRELSTKLGRQPTSEEVSADSGIAHDKVRKLEGYLMEQAVSLDREVTGDDGRRFIDFIQDDEALLPSDSVIYRSMNDQVLEILNDLKPIEADILRKRFGLADGRELTLKEIGEDYNLSRERIRQLQEQALGKIRRALQRQEPV